MNLDDYLAKLALTPPAQPDLAFLQRLVVRHLECFSFNNLAVLLKQPLPLDIPALLDKVVYQQRGGYCFEHNKLAYQLLEHLGYSPKIVLGRVLNNYIRPVPRTHRFNLLELNGEKYLLDVGFGPACPVGLIALSQANAQPAGLDSYRIRALENNEYELLQDNGSEPFILYRFDLAEYSEADCELGHFYSHQHPDVVFVNNLLVSRKNAEQVWALSNTTFTHRQGEQHSETLVSSATQLHQLLTQYFFMALAPEVCEFLFERYLAPKLPEAKSDNRASQ